MGKSSDYLIYLSKYQISKMRLEIAFIFSLAYVINKIIFPSAAIIVLNKYIFELYFRFLGKRFLAQLQLTIFGKFDQK